MHMVFCGVTTNVFFFNIYSPFNLCAILQINNNYFNTAVCFFKCKTLKIIIATCSHFFLDGNTFF